MNLPRFRQRVLKWYATHARSLPWRGTVNPYRVWISEIMLQQTTTQTVQGYFDRFTKAFPTVHDLAKAKLDDVNRLWEGLGYYRRAAQLHKAAKEIVEKYNGVFPTDFAAVLALPGIGRYTAGAILSITTDQRLPILEANTVRLHARLLALQADPTTTEANRVLWKFAEDVLPKIGSGRFNQALMDIGSMVCTPNNPRCGDCPIVSFCETAKLGLQTTIPFRKEKSKPEEKTELAVLVKKRGRVLLVKYPHGVRWAGLWDFPRTELDDSTDSEKNAAATLSQMTGRKIVPGMPIETIKHTVTRFRITLQFCEALDDGLLTSETFSAPYETRWATPLEMASIPLNSTARKLWNRVNNPKTPD